MNHDVIDDIYEAAFTPEKWESVLDRMADISLSTSASMIVMSDHFAPRGMVSPAFSGIFNQQFVGAGEWEKSIRVKTMLAIRPHGFVLIDDFVSAADSASDPAWSRLREHGLAYQLCAMIPMSSGECVTFTTERRLEQGAYSASDFALLDGLRPHLARSGLVAARLGLERARAAAAVLEALGLPAAILTQSGTVMAANGALEKLSAMIMPKAWGGLTIANPAANILYQESIGQMRSGDLAGLRSIPVPAGPGYPAAVLHILPVRGDARDIFSGSENILVVSTMDGRAASSSLLCALFDLTPAEARLADRLVAGAPLDQIALSHAVSITTVRSQLRSIFAKTGTSRQAQLVALLSSLWSPPTS